MGSVDDAIEQADRLADEDRLDEALAVLRAALGPALSGLDRARLATEVGWKLYDGFPDREESARQRAEEALALLAREPETAETLAVQGSAHCLLAHCLWSTDSEACAAAARRAVDVLGAAIRQPSSAGWMRWAACDAARAYLLLEDGQKAIPCCQRFLTEARHDRERRFGLGILGEAYRVAGRLAEAEQAISEAIRTAQTSPRRQTSLYHSLGLIQRAKARPGEARVSFERAAALLEADPARHPAQSFQAVYGHLAEVTAEQGDHARTAGVLRRLLEFYPDDDRNRLGVVNWLAGCCLELRLYAEARAHYDAILASPAASEDEQAAAASQALWCLAAAAYQNRDYRIARDLFGRLLDYNSDADGNRHVVLLWLGNVHYALRGYERARDCYEEVLTSAWASEDQRATAQEWVDWSAAHIHAGAGRHAEAAARMKQRLARYAEDSPERCAALLFLGECCAAAGDLARARECYDAVWRSPRATETEKAEARRRLGRERGPGGHPPAPREEEHRERPTSL